MDSGTASLSLLRLRFGNGFQDVPRHALVLGRPLPQHVHAYWMGTVSVSYQSIHKEKI